MGENKDIIDPKVSTTKIAGETRLVLLKWLKGLPGNGETCWVPGERERNYAFQNTKTHVADPGGKLLLNPENKPLLLVATPKHRD